MDQYVDRIYLINLDKETGRLERSDLLLKKLGWNYTRFVAKTIEDCNPDQFKVHLNNGERACLWSHRELIREAYEAGLNRILIFEDDVSTYLDSKRIEAELEILFQGVKEGKWETPNMIYLGKCLDNCFALRLLEGNLFQTFEPLCLHAYIVDRVTMATLLAMDYFPNPIDVIFADLIKSGKLRAYTYHPSLFFQDNFNNTSSLRGKDASIVNYCECRIFGSYSRNIIIAVIVILTAMIIIFLLILYYCHKIMQSSSRR